MQSTQPLGHAIADKIEKIQNDFEKQWGDQEKSNMDWREIKAAIQSDAKNFNQLTTVASITSRFLEIKNYWKNKNTGKMDDAFYRGVRLFLVLTECYFMINFLQRTSKALSFDSEEFNSLPIPKKIKYVDKKQKISENFFEHQSNKDLAIEFLQLKMKEVEKNIIEYMGTSLEWFFSYLNLFSWGKWDRMIKAANTFEKFAAEINAAFSKEANNGGSLSLQDKEELYIATLSNHRKELAEHMDNNENKSQYHSPIKITRRLKPKSILKSKKTHWFTCLYDQPWKKGVIGGMVVLGLVALGLTGWGLIAELSFLTVIGSIGGVLGALLIGGGSFLVPFSLAYNNAEESEIRHAKPKVSFHPSSTIRGSMSAMPFTLSRHREAEPTSRIESKYSGTQSPAADVADCAAPTKQHRS